MRRTPAADPPATRDARRLVLASGSPRRREALAGLGLEFIVRPVDVDESPRAGEAPDDYVARLAGEKAVHDVRAGELVLAADTIVVLDGELLGKPADAAEARRMLARLAGREHTVLTGVAVQDGPAAAGRAAPRIGVESSRVSIAPMSEPEIAWYVGTGEPLDKAGAYAIQGLGALFVERVEGNYSNVVGLPLPLTYRLFRAAGVELLAFRRDGGGSGG